MIMGGQTAGPIFFLQEGMFEKKPKYAWMMTDVDGILQYKDD